MKGYLAILVVLLMLVPAGNVSLADPTITMDQPKENDVINMNVFTLSGTAAGSTGAISVTSELQFQSGSHENTTTTATGDVIIFPIPVLVKQNNNDPVLSNASTGTFDFKDVSTPGVVLRGTTYHMWYSGNDKFNNRIGYATSTDGIVWTRQNGGAAVMDKGGANDFDSFGVFDPCIIDTGTSFQMWYSASDGGKNRIGYASSPDGIVWTKNSGPVLDLGDFSKFDEDGVMGATVIKIGSTYHMWYTGVSGTATGLGYATSPDGIAWTRQNGGNSVLEPTQTGTFDSTSIGAPSVVLFNNVYLMYYSGYNGNKYQIGVATSVDGTHWVRRNGGNPVLVPTNGYFDWKSVAAPTVLWHQSTVDMWYSGQNATTNQIGYAKGVIGQVKGTYTSPPFDLGGNVDFQKINWTVDTPAGTTVIVIARTQTKGKAWTSWFTPTNGADLGAADGMLFQYLVNLTSDDIAKTPAFKDLTLQYFSAVVRVEVSSTGITWTPCSGTDIWSCDVQAANGKALIRARSIDSTGAHSDVLYLNVTVNGDVPKGTIKINNGKNVTTERVVSLNISATDSAGVPSMMVSEDPTFQGVSWEDYKQTKVWTLSPGDGYKFIYARFKDTYGLVSPNFNSSILLDMTPPNGTIMIQNGSKFANSRAVTIQLHATDNNSVDGAMISEDKTFQGLQPGQFAEEEFFTLSQGDGVKTIYVRYYDVPGNFKDYSTSIILDTTEPTGALKINNGAAVTLTRMVNLTIDGRDKNGIKEMMISNLPGLNGTAWEPYKENKLWNLTQGEGAKVVYIKYKDNAGLLSEVVQDAIQYNPPPPNGIVTINNGEKYTSDKNVTLQIQIGAEGDILQMQVSDDPTFANAQWGPYETNMTWTLPTGDGVRTVYARFLTLAGIQTEIYSGNITLDTTSPVVQVLQPTPSTTYTVATALLRVRATDVHGIDKVEVRLDNGEWVQATQNKTDKAQYYYTLVYKGKGVHNVQIRATDPAGNSAETQISFNYKPKQKKKTPFLDTSLVVLALAMAVLVVAAKKKKN
jgi:hypothetical protein